MCFYLLLADFLSDSPPENDILCIRMFTVNYFNQITRNCRSLVNIEYFIYKQCYLRSLGKIASHFVRNRLMSLLRHRILKDVQLFHWSLTGHRQLRNDFCSCTVSSVFFHSFLKSVRKWSPWFWQLSAACYPVKKLLSENFSSPGTSPPPSSATHTHTHTHTPKLRIKVHCKMSKPDIIIFQR